MVSGEVRPSPGLTTWAVGRGDFGTGAGVIVGVGPAARAVSDAGREIRTRTLESWGLDESADGYRASQSCSEKATRTSKGRHRVAPLLGQRSRRRGV